MSNFIRVLRNGTIYSSREVAKTKLEEQLAKLQDGEICLASYGASWETAKTILGVVRTKGATPSYTIFDNEDIDGIMATIQQLDATVRGNLNANDAVDTGKHVGVKVVEKDGKLTEVTVVESDIASAKLLGNLGDGSNVESAFGRIAKEAADRASAITGAIAALDSEVYATAAVDDKVYSVLTGVKQVDGKLTEKTEVTLAAVAKTGSAADVATTAIVGDTTQVAVAGTNVSDQISSIATTLKGVQNSIDTVEKNALNYRTVKLSESEVTALSDSNVKEAYQVVSYTGEWVDGTTIGTPVGVPVKIYKDATIHQIYLGTKDDSIDSTSGAIDKKAITDETKLTLNYSYIQDNGKYDMVKVPVDSFLRESEFKDGLQVNSGVVSVKVDTTEGAENFLSVGQNGVKISGVQTAINNAIAGLHADVTSTGDSNVTVNLTEENGVVTAVNVTTPGLALDNAVVKAVTVNGVNATVTSNKADVTIDGADIAVADNYTATVYPEQFDAKVGANHIATDDTVAAALKKTENTISVLATEVISNEKVTTAAVSKLAESAGVTNTDGVIKYTPKTDANYIGNATSVHDATVKLDDAIKAVEGNANNALTEVQGSNAITVSTKAEKKQTVSLKLDNTKDGNGDGTTPKPAGANALEVNANGLYLSNVWDCGEY